MPAVSQAQQRTMAACEHGVPLQVCTKIHKSMSKAQIHEFAKTPRAGLPKHVRPVKGLSHILSS